MKKNGMNFKALNCVLFCIPLFTLGLISIFTTNKPTVSELENRLLKAMPVFHVQTLLSGDLFKEYEEYFSDTFAFRELFVSAAMQIKAFRGFPSENKAVLVAGGANYVPEDEENIEDEMQAGTGEGIQIARSKNDPLVMQTKPDQEGTASSNVTPLPDSTPNAGEQITDTVDTTPVGKPEAQPTERTTAQPTKQPTELTTVQPTDTPNNQPTEQEQIDNEPLGTPTPRSERDLFLANVQENTENKLSQILVIGGRGMEVFEFHEQACKNYAAIINNFQRTLGNSVKIYSMLVPSQIEFYNDKKYADLSYPEQDAMKFIWDQMDDRIVPVSVYNNLKQHTDEYIYFRTDHHWTALGAYYGYAAFMNLLGVTPVPLEKYETETVTGYLGSMYKNTYSAVMQANPDTITVYKPFIQHTYAITGDKYVRNSVIDMAMAKTYKFGVFLSSMRYLAKITTDTKNGKKLLVIKDSFAQPFIPFLMMHYEEIYVFDPRKSKNEDLIALIHEQGIQELLFLNYMQSVTEFSDYIDKMSLILKTE